MLRYNRVISTTIAAVAAMILLAGATRLGGAQTSQSSTTQKDLVDLQKKFQDLTVAGDSAGVSALMSDEAIFIHGNGAAQSKAEFLTAMATGQLAFSLYDLKDPKVVIFDGGAIVSGLVDIAFKVPAGSTAPPRVLHMRGSSVWVQRPSGWRLILDQDTTIPAPLPPPAAAPAAPAPPAAH
ncbi:MAG TPA: nuclear transport factor 2 family protein [Candidatus Acidoferrales bacterium]|nr:nuclear transport factor 2 family protein [Candidatus Acidoferrales bacterium]